LKRRDILPNKDARNHLKILKIVSPEDPTKLVGPGEPGSICIRKPLMMKGYLNREDETRKFFDSDGFAHVGDIVKFDQEGKIYYIERFKEMIK
jgi:long-subunit acyl-CoA synthetase (AMP-forming)